MLSKLAIAVLTMLIGMAMPLIATAQITPLTNWAVKTNQGTLFTTAGTDLWLEAEAPTTGTKGKVRAEIRCHAQPTAYNNGHQILEFRLVFTNSLFPVRSYTDDYGRVNYVTDLLAKLDLEAPVKIGATVNQSGTVATFDNFSGFVGPISKDRITISNTLTIGSSANENFALKLSFGPGVAERFLNACWVEPFNPDKKSPN